MTRTYRGQTIYPCERAPGEHAGRWTIQSYHHTGMSYVDDLCPHYPTMAAARQAIDESKEN